MTKISANSKPIENDLKLWDMDDSNLNALIGDPNDGETDFDLSLEKPDSSDGGKEDLFKDFDPAEKPKKKPLATDDEEEEEGDEESEEFSPDLFGEDEDEDEDGDKKRPDPKSTEDAETDAEENEFSVFAKLLQENELLDLPEDFEASAEGLMDAFAGTIESRVKEEIELFQKALPEEGKDLLRHLMQGGKVSDFSNVYSAPDVVSLNLEGEKNIPSQKAVLQEFLRLKGDSAEEIRETVQDYEALGKLEGQAKKAQARLGAYYDAQKKDLAVRQAREQENKEQKRVEVLTSIQKTIETADEIKGFPISRKVKKDLISYMTENTVKIDGPQGPQYVTKFQADELEAGKTIDDFILKAYLRMTDFNLEGVQKKTTTALSTKLKDQLQRVKSKTGTHAKFGSNKRAGTSSEGAWVI